jgi:ubiquinone/menaquinone biosynthesis C-methylase UbiE
VAFERDPEGSATRYLRAFVDLANSRVLDVGCGDGHLAWRYAPATRSIAAIEPSAMELAGAIHSRPPAQRDRVPLIQARAEALPFRSESFDAALRAWSF